MPSLKTHIKVAYEVSNALKINKEEFYLGNLLPDLTNECNHKKSHFSQNRIPNISSYLNNFKDLSLTSIELGYLCHLLTDKFYNKFIFQKYIEKKENRLISINLNGIKKYYDEEKINNLKHSVYENYDKYLIQNNLLNPIEKLDFLNSCKMPRIDGISFNIEYLKDYIKHTNNDISNPKENNSSINYVFSNQDELDNLLSECCIYIVNFLKENNIKIID